MTGRYIGKLKVLGRSDKYGSRGSRKVQLWECRCDCGAITYKATDTLTAKGEHACAECAAKSNASKAREKAGFCKGTQVGKIKNTSMNSSNSSGVRGVYIDKKTGKYIASLRFKRVKYYLGTYSHLDDAINARRRGEKEIYGTFLSSLENDESGKVDV